MKRLNLFCIFLFIYIVNIGVLFAQGNYNLENFGNQSILLSGNVTGSVNDLGLTYYNPARIALIEKPAFSINAQGYQINTVEIENAFGNNKKLNDTKFNAIPGMVAGTFKIKSLEGHHFAYSFISKRRFNTDIQYSSEVQVGDFYGEIEGLETFVGEVNLRNKISEEWYGLTWGKRLTENLSIGITGFISIYNSSGSNRLKFATLEESEDVLLYNNDIGFIQDSYGMFWKLGLAWKLPKFDLGLNIDLPYIEIFGNGSFDFQEFLSNTGDANDIFSYQSFDDIEALRKVPLGISIGAGVSMGKNTLHLKMDWHNKIDEYDRLKIPVIDEDLGDMKSFVFKDELRSVINFGVGAEIYINSKYNAYASFSTDFSPTERNANIFDLIADDEKDVNLALDYYHFGLGVDMKLSWAKMVLGTTFSTGSTNFSQPVDFPKPETSFTEQNGLSKMTLTRWRIIIGIEIPVFGYKIDVK